MDSKIVETLELMYDKDNPQDKKILLLAELVETKCSALGRNQEGLKSSLDSTNNKLDRLTELLEKYEQDTHGCPVYRNRNGYERLSLFVRFPRLFILIVIGLLALLSGFFGAKIENVLKIFFEL